MEDKMHQVLEKASSINATDVHFDFIEKTCTIDYKRFKKSIAQDVYLDGKKLMNYLKYISCLDLAASMLPQSGSFSYIIENREYHYRYSVLSTIFRESGVLRILNTDSNLSLEDCINDKKISQKLLDYGNYKSGLILFSGTTGSGKSTTMFTLLKALSERKIYTLEDPIERYHKDLIQLQVNQRQGLSFDVGVKQLLRQDPEIIVVGEIRDRNELRSVIRCSLTGHLVMSTIHASSSQMTLSRLIELGAKEHEVREILLLISYQRIDENNEKPAFNVIEKNEFLFNKR